MLSVHTVASGFSRTNQLILPRAATGRNSTTVEPSTILMQSTRFDTTHEWFGSTRTRFPGSRAEAPYDPDGGMLLGESLNEPARVRLAGLRILEHERRNRESAGTRARRPS